MVMQYPCGVSELNRAHLFEGQLACQFEAHHHHASNPEEQDVMAGLEQSARIEYVQVLGLYRRLQQCYIKTIQDTQAEFILNTL